LNLITTRIAADRCDRLLGCGRPRLARL